MKELHLSIVSPEKSIFDGDVKIVTLPGMIGSFSILPGHAPIVSSLKAGGSGLNLIGADMVIHYDPHTMDIQGGFVEMSDGTVSACVS
jgi:F-type H+-transporting ATPase subunit epsilon